MPGTGFSWPSFGVLHQGWATEERSDADVLADVIRSTILADRLGYDVAWFTEQHTRMFGATWGRIATPHLLIAHIAARTERIRLGTAVRLVMDQEVTRIAEELLTLELITKGRVEFGVGAGMAQPGDVAAREARRDCLRTRTAELARVLRGQEDGAPQTLAVQNLSDRIHIATTDPRSLALAAREGFGYLVGMFGGQRHGDLVRVFRELGGQGMVRATRMVFVGENERTARETVGHAASYFWKHFTPPSPEWRKAVLAAGTRLSLDDICAQLGWIVGGPISVAAHLAHYMISTGLDGLDLSFHVPGLDATAADRSMEIFAAAVRPEVVRIVNEARQSGGVMTERKPEKGQVSA